MSFGSRVVCSLSWAIKRCSLSAAFKRDDFPTFGRPMTETRMEVKSLMSMAGVPDSSSFVNT